MIAVIFELEPEKNKAANYFSMADSLKPLLQEVDGFVSIERFQSLTSTNRYLSLSFWRDEEAIKNWRNTQQHRQAQELGREAIFKQYRLRVADVRRDYSLDRREQAPQDSNTFFSRNLL